VNGRQYIAMPVGTGGGGWSGAIVSDLIPEGRIAQGMNSMFVFALP
jgi:alcohol dehydrogenase (cytochrome c)